MKSKTPNIGFQRTAPCGLAAEAGSLGVTSRYVAILIGLVAVGCAGRKLTFRPFEHVTRIEVRRHGSGTSSITSLAQIASVVAFDNQELAGWEVPLAGVPIPDTRADMYSASTFLGHLGVGSGFLESQRDGTFASKGVSPAREQLFRKMLSVAAGQKQ